MTLEAYLNGAKFVVQSGTFAIVKASAMYSKAFVTIVDDAETTVIVDEALLHEVQAIEIQRGFKVITLEVVLPMHLVGVTAKIATALADAGVAIMPVAAYSRDHFLVREADLDRGLAVLERIGERGA
jgi:hypothetical protein